MSGMKRFFYWGGGGLRFESANHFIRRHIMQLAQVIEGFFLYRRSRLASTTQRNYRYCFDKLIGYFGDDTSFTDITALDMRRFLEHLHSTGLSDRSVHDNLVICSSLWTFAHQEFG